MKYVRNILAIFRGLRAPFDKKNAQVILLCLITAFIFWFFNSLNKEYTARIDFPIEFSFDRDSLISLDRLPSKISINVTGGGWTLLRKSVGLSDKPITIDLENPTSQKYLTQYNLLNIASDQLEELTVNFIINDTVFFNIENKVKKKVKVGIDTANVHMAENHEIVSKIFILPDSVELEGPQSMIEELSSPLILPVPDSNIDEDFSEEIPVSLGLPELVASSPRTVEVEFEVEEFQIKESDFKIQRINFPENHLFLLSTSVVNASVYYPLSKREWMDTLDLKVVADYQKLNPEDSTIQLQFQHVPDFIKNHRFSQPIVKLIYQ